MRLREPDNLKMNFLRLIPLFMLAMAVVLTGLLTYRYFGDQSAQFWQLGLGFGAVIYFAIRSWGEMNKVFVWGDDTE